MNSWHSYSHIWALGHPRVADIFNGPVVMQEKIDGSQLSWGVIDGKLRIRSKGQEFPVEAPQDLFVDASSTILKLFTEGKLHEGWTYRGESIQRPKHNVLVYERTPPGNVIIFDINTDIETYLDPSEVTFEAERLELITVPLLYEGDGSKITEAIFMKWLEQISCLGNVPIEGIVVKNYNQFGRDKKVLMAKYVSEAFKEQHRSEWKGINKKAFTELLANQYKTDARWLKAIQHLREEGKLESDPKDIGLLFKEIAQDFEKECEEEVKEALWKHFKKDLIKRISRGFPEWYKQYLLKQQFNEKM